MNEISCEMCMDLMPLVRDGVASEDSRRAVERHVQTCAACRAVYDGEKPPVVNTEDGLAKAVKRLRTVSGIILAVVVLLGICLCELVMQGSSILFLALVAVIGWLGRIVFDKGRGMAQILKKTAAFLGAVTLIAAVLWTGNEVFGNPVSKNRAEKAVQGYLAENYGQWELYVDEISYTTSSATYEAKIKAASPVEFCVVYRDGKILYDTYNTIS